MRKTSVYLSDDEAEGLRRTAAAEGIAQAQLIREGIRRVIAEAERRPRTFHSLGKGRGGGRPYERWAAEDLYRRAIG
jgi:hypothetical protein